MIKVQKDYDSIPESLKPTTKDFFPDGNYPQKSKTTHEKRKEMIAKGHYVDTDRYALDDVKVALETIYNRKCAYCEQKVGCDVEHYRPKRQYPPIAGQNPGIHQAHDGYFWLSLSWDNLLLACRDCNIPKGSIFDINGNRATLDKRKIGKYRRIHQFGDEYDGSEQPLMLNPEKDDPNDHLRFSADGHVEGTTDRGRYTRDVCRLDRDRLVDNRRVIIDDFKLYLESALDSCDGDVLQMEKVIEGQVRAFMSAAQDSTREYQGFRLQACGWIGEVLKTVLK